MNSLIELSFHFYSLCFSSSSPSSDQKIVHIKCVATFQNPFRMIYLLLIKLNIKSIYEKQFQNSILIEIDRANTGHIRIGIVNFFIVYVNWIKFCSNFIIIYLFILRHSKCYECVCIFGWGEFNYANVSSDSILNCS